MQSVHKDIRVWGVWGERGVWAREAVAIIKMFIRPCCLAGHDSPVALKLWGKPRCHLGPDRHTSVSYQAEQQIHHLHQIKIDQRGSMHGSGKCLPWKLRSWTLPAIKRLVPGYGCHPDSHPTISETQPTCPDLSTSSTWALPAATWLGGVLIRGVNCSVALCYIGLSTGAWQNEKKRRRTQSNI